MPTRESRQPHPAREPDGSSPVLWFALLERARLTSDRVMERRARRALARAGIHVTYGPGGHRPGHLRLSRDELERIAARLADLLRGMPR